MSNPFKPFSLQAAPNFPTAGGPRLANHPAPLVIPRDRAAALAFAQHCDLRADLLLSEGCTIHAERLAHLALEARTRAMGGRA